MKIKQNKNSKKAQMMGKVVAVVVMVIAIILLIQLPAWTGDVAEQTAERLACITSLEKAQQLKMIGGSLADGLGNAVSINCPTQYHELFTKEEKLNRDAADHIYDCFTLYKGKNRLFDTSAGTYCIVCKVLTMKSAEQFEGLIDFMAKEKPLASARQTYIEGMGGEQAFPSGAKEQYNNYRFNEGEEISVIVTFGTTGFSQQMLAFDSGTKIGILLYPYKSMGNIGCYAFEGSSTGLEYKK